MKVLMVDDHKVIVSSLAQILYDEPDIEQVACAGSFDEAVRRLDEQDFDVAVVDIELPGRSGLELARHCRMRHGDCKVVILTGAIAAAHVHEALRLGVSGFLLKTIDPRDLVNGLRVASRGIDVFDAEASPQQLRVLRHVALGMTNKEVARAMGISEKTARNYLASVFEKLGLQRRSEAAVWYSRHVDDAPASSGSA